METLIRPLSSTTFYYVWTAVIQFVNSSRLADAEISEQKQVCVRYWGVSRGLDTPPRQQSDPNPERGGVPGMAKAAYWAEQPGPSSH